MKVKKDNFYFFFGTGNFWKRNEAECVYMMWMKCVLYSFARRAPCRLYCGGLVMTHDVIFYYFYFFLLWKGIIIRWSIVYGYISILRL